MKTLIFKEDEKRSMPVLFLHGFPGVNSKQNRDIAENVAHALGRTCVVPMYTGLGQTPGLFSFKNCRTEIFQVAQELLDRSPQQQIDVVGHSWGGFLAISLAAKSGAQIRKLVLMSPLLKLLGSNEADLDLIKEVRSNPDLNLAATDQLLGEFEEFRKAGGPTDLIEKISAQTEVLILQAKDDPITPTQFAVEATSHFAHAPRFELVHTDHGFLSARPMIANKIAQFLGP